MKHPGPNAAKEIYQRLRTLTPQELWDHEIPLFDGASAKQRVAQVGLIRAVGTVFSRFGSELQKQQGKDWLLKLLRDPEEKIRRYAIAALPLLEAGPEVESAFLALLQATENEREKKYLGAALDKIGGRATLEMIESGVDFSSHTEHKVKASLARRQHPSRILLDAPFNERVKMRIHLRCRSGLEMIVKNEVERRFGRSGKFRLLDVHKGLVAIGPMKPFTLSDLYELRCCGSFSFVLGRVGEVPESAAVDEWAAFIASPLAKNLLGTFTEGSLRYRLSFSGKGAKRSLVKAVATRAFELSDDILNDAREAPWAVEIYPIKKGTSVELRPRLSPDPRWFYRTDDVPAASHPPLAACLASLAQTGEEEIVWDPFCGSGLELIERALLGGVRKLFGTDLSEAAVAIARQNIAAADLQGVESKVVCCDFRDFARIDGLGPASVTLVISNPPLGRRIRITGLRDLFKTLFRAAATVLKPGGRLVFVNPFQMDCPVSSLELESRQTVDLGGYNCRLEVYRKKK
jgi:23S rRNA G2445 N2-methylase RlmL